MAALKQDLSGLNKLKASLASQDLREFATLLASWPDKELFHADPAVRATAQQVQQLLTEMERFFKIPKANSPYTCEMLLAWLNNHYWHQNHRQETYAVLNTLKAAEDKLKDFTATHTRCTQLQEELVRYEQSLSQAADLQKAQEQRIEKLRTTIHTLEQAFREEESRVQSSQLEVLDVNRVGQWAKSFTRSVANILGTSSPSGASAAQAAFTAASAAKNVPCKSLSISCPWIKKSGTRSTKKWNTTSALLWNDA